MNIDVTAVSSDGKTWSEKFTDIFYAFTEDGTLHIQRSNSGRPVAYDTELETVASFAPGAWHSWRRID